MASLPIYYDRCSGSDLHRFRRIHTLPMHSYARTLGSQRNRCPVCEHEVNILYHLHHCGDFHRNRPVIGLPTISLHPKNAATSTRQDRPLSTHGPRHLRDHHVHCQNHRRETLPRDGGYSLGQHRSLPVEHPRRAGGHHRRLHPLPEVAL